MDIKKRNNVQVVGKGTKTLILAHGFGCDQNMWRLLTPRFKDEYKIVLFDIVGCGLSDETAYDANKYNTLNGYADDLIEIIREVSEDPVVLVGHSVSAIIGLLATIKASQLFRAHIMIGPSPSYINDGEYIGGFSKVDIEELIKAIDNNYLGWSSATAPVIMGANDQPELGEELTNSFCRTNPEISKHFAKVTFLSDHREDLSKSLTPTLIIQCSEDFIAPISIGEYMLKTMKFAQLHLIDNVGHCPHLSSPDACGKIIEEYLNHME